MQVDKQTAARHMINCAIRNVFAGECPISNHVLILSAKEILLGIARSTGTPLKLDPTAIVRAEHRSAFINLLKERYNFFKHADQDHDFEIDITNIQYSNEMELMLVIDNYKDIFQSVTLHMQTFQLYFFLEHPNICDLDKAYLSSEDRGIIQHYSALMTEGGRKSLCGYFEGHLRRKPDAVAEREEASELSFAAEEDVTPRGGDLKGPFFKRKKQGQ